MTSRHQTNGSGRPIVSPGVALTLLEVIQDQDRPEEILQDEDLSITMPRRLGLSDVILTQVMRYREEARKGHRITEEETGDLLRLVARRPDAAQVFAEAGRRLSESGGRPPRKAKLKGRMGRALARRRVKKRLKSLFGKRVGAFGQGVFSLEGTGLLFVRHVPAGDACHLVSGLCQGILSGPDVASVRVRHSSCQARGDESCQWTVGASSEPGGAALAEDTGLPSPA